jgi:hypothetical protein
VQLARELESLHVRARRIAGAQVTGALSPVELAAQAGFTLDPWQRDVLTSPAHEIILNVTRQGGKSTVSSMRGLHRALYNPRSLVLLLAPSYRQSKELFRKVTDAYNALPAPVAVAAESALELELVNDSRIVALPGKEATIRGFSGVSLLIVDEASRVPDALYQAVRPMLAVSGGDILLLSTPFGKRGFFHQEWTAGGATWQRTLVTAHECPRIDPKWLERERNTIGDWWYRQEYLCNPPDAPVWMGDFSFQPLGDVKAGDTVIGWHRPRPGGKRFLTRSQVLGVRRREAEMVEVQMASGNRIFCTPDHRWLTMSAGHGEDWFQPVSAGKKLVRVINPTAPLPERLRWDAAWLGGVYDGEGSANHIAQSVSHNPIICERIHRTLHDLGFKAGHHKEGFYILSQNGGRDFKQALVNFLNWTRPTKRDRHMDRLILSAHFRHSDTVTNVQPAGRGEVVSMQTTTGNYVVWGYASKNCEFVETDDQVFSYADVQRALDPAVRPLFEVAA